MKNHKSPTIETSLLDEWIYLLGKPSIAVSDQAKNVDDIVVRELYDSLGIIEKRRSTPYHPEGDEHAKGVHRQ